MQDADLLVQLAGIAGVFVGFGALIAVRSGGASEVREVISDIRWVMSSAIWVAIAALVPIIVSRYGIAGHDLWLASSLFALVLFAVMIIVNAGAPENLEDVRAALDIQPRAKLALVMGPTFWLPTVLLVLALVLVALSLFPNQEPALYLTAVGLGLFTSAMQLFVTAFWRTSPASA